MKLPLTFLTSHWSPYSRLFLIGDKANWVLDWEIHQIRELVHEFGICTPRPWVKKFTQHQSMFFPSLEQLIKSELTGTDWRVGAAYFHGRPGEGNEVFDQRYEFLCRNHAQIDRIQVANKAFQQVVLDSGIDPSKVHLIPIAVNPAWFTPQTSESRKAVRAEYSIPDNAVVVGSFQKDGEGWEEGMTPKFIKGPDLLLDTIAVLKKKRLKKLYVLLAGPARGYVKAGLDKLKVPYQHIFLDHYPDIGKLYHALDAYIITSREEGGPKGVLESMASGVPVISTKVGQAVDLIHHSRNGFLADINDSQSLAHWLDIIYHKKFQRTQIVKAGLKTANANTYASQKTLWQHFMKGFVDVPK